MNYNNKLSMTMVIVYCTLLLNGQTTIPSDFYGINAWMPDSIGTARYWGDLENHWADIENANAKLIRIGGIAPDKNFYTNYQLIKLIDTIRARGAEPIVQVPLWAGTKTATEAADLVEYVNVTKGRNVKYWSIGNEPNLTYNATYNGFSAGNYTYSDYATDVKDFSIAMKTKDASIKVIAGEFAWYYSVWITPLLTPGGADDITGNNGTHDYVDYFSFHTYGFSGNATQTRENVIAYVDNYKSGSIADLKTKITAANAYHTRNNPLEFGVTEMNVSYSEPSSNETNGVGSKSLLAGQWWADMLLSNAEEGMSFINFWSVVEGGAANASTDHGFIDHDNSTLRPTYYHFQMCAKYMTENIYTTTDNQDSVRAYVTKNSDYGYSVMILNYDIDNSFDMRLRLNTDAIAGSETLKINVDASVAKEITETIPANATVLMFLSPDGHYIGKYTYDQDDVDNDNAPTFEIYQPTRTKKVFAHYLPWFDVDGQYDGTLRRGWCHEGDCTDLTNNSSVYEPIIGEYSQFDDEVIKYHVRQAIAARIDGFLVNINPEWDYAWKLFHKICDAIIAVNDECPSNDFQVAISFDNSSKTDLADITPLFQLCKDSLYGHPQFTHIAWKDDVTGKYVMTVWSEANWDNYRTAINSVFEQDSIFAIGRNVINFDLFDGNMEWVGYLTNDQSNTTDWGEQSFNDSDWVMARQLDFGLKDIRSINSFKLGNAYPGFDDRNVPISWNGGTDRYFARNVTDGEVMELTWNHHVNYTYKRLGGDFNIANDWIQLVTWNDFPEGTSIEPARIGTDYGYIALQTNRKKIAEFKNVTTTTADTFGIYVAKAIYDAVKAGRTSDANTALTYFCNEEYENAIAFAENGTLPVELLSFNGFYERNKNVLTWEVGEKINHSHFEIQHSRDGIHFETLGTDYEDIDNYTFHHIAPPKGVNYYRLKQNDIDGAFKFSKIISIQVPVSSIKIITHNNEIEFITDQNIDKVEVYNVLGQQLEVNFDGRILTTNYNGVLWVKYLIDGVWLVEKVFL